MGAGRIVGITGNTADLFQPAFMSMIVDRGIRNADS